MESKKKKTQKIDEEAEARINNAYADFMEKAMNADAEKSNSYRDQTKRMIEQKRKKQKK